MSQKIYENFQTLNGAYLVEETKDGFDNFTLGETDVEIKMMPRTGTKEFANFSNHCIVKYCPENGKYKAGQHIWVPHLIAKNKVDASSFLKDGKGLLYCGEHNILFDGEDLENVDTQEWVVFRIQQQHEVEENGITVIVPEDDDVGFVISGALEEGDKITWVTSKRVEFWQNEKQYWVTHIDSITSVNGRVYGEHYAIDTFKEYELIKDGVILKGQQAAMKLNKIDALPSKKHLLVKLSNPDLPYHGKTAIIRRVKPMPYIHQNALEVIL